MWLPHFISRLWDGVLSGFEVQGGTRAAAGLVGMLEGQGIHPSASGQGFPSLLLSVTPLIPCRAGRRGAGKLGLGTLTLPMGTGLDPNQFGS